MAHKPNHKLNTKSKKALASMYGDPNKITRGDIITAAKKKKNGTSKKSKKS
jgi:hypothetical protein